LFNPHPDTCRDIHFFYRGGDTLCRSGDLIPPNPYPIPRVVQALGEPYCRSKGTLLELKY